MSSQVPEEKLCFVFVLNLCICRSCEPGFRPHTHGNVFLRFCIVSSNELVVLDSLENSKQYKNAGKRFRVHVRGLSSLLVYNAVTNVIIKVYYNLGVQL